jgi:hypothetical protein
MAGYSTLTVSPVSVAGPPASDIRPIASLTVTPSDKISIDIFSAPARRSNCTANRLVYSEMNDSARHLMIVLTHPHEKYRLTTPSSGHIEAFAPMVYLNG